ncbi:MAG: ATP-binding cassette domain-containing protein [Chloroflexi bacterium]|nr:ATP-binding cassette domain-containing protein [Chloroflexota bacterium]
MIEVDSLTKRYGEKTAIDGVTFQVARGEILGFLGPNGAGKSTTMRILSGYMPASSGTARINGFDVFEHSLDARRQIGYLPENVPLYHEMTVRDYIGFVADIKGVAAKFRSSRVDDAIEKARVDDRADWIIGRLSKGYRQRVGLAQALVANPPILILDEPTVGLDPRQIIETRNLIRSLAGEHTVILSTHILPEVSATCERVVIINRGRVVAVDDPESLARHIAGGQQFRVRVGEPEQGLVASILCVAGVADARVETRAASVLTVRVQTASDRDVRPEVVRRLIAGGWDLFALEASSASLEDVFLAVTTTEPTGAAGEGQIPTDEVAT